MKLFERGRFQATVCESHCAFVDQNAHPVDACALLTCDMTESTVAYTLHSVVVIGLGLEGQALGTLGS
eukprot:13988-Eustigmatos_ZCMA.PRE.1